MATKVPIELIIQAVLLILEAGPGIYDAIVELVDNSDMETFDKEELKARIKAAQDKWKEWV